MFSWYYIFSNEVLKFIIEVSSNFFLIYHAYFNFLVVIAIISSVSFIHKRINKIQVLYGLFVISCLGTIFIILPSTILRLIIYFFLGAWFGLSVPSFFTYLWDITVPEERGRVIGLIGCIMIPIILLVVFLAKNLNLSGILILLISLNLGALFIKLLNPEKIVLLTEKKIKKGYSPEKRTIILYSTPWIIFSLINATLAKAVTVSLTKYLPLSITLWLYILQILSASFGSVVGGVIADFFGRRTALAFGLTLYGISSAITGLAKGYESLFSAFVFAGLTWGSLSTLYLFVIWGDLANEQTVYRRYSLGLSIFYFAQGIGSLFGQEILQIPSFLASILSCLLIFLSNIPLILAPELLSSDFREKIRLRLYIYLIKKKLG